MKTSSKRRKAFTLAELIIAMGVSVILSVGFMYYFASALRLMIRNLATNHSHETARASLEKMLSQLHGSASRLQLVTYDGTNYTDVTAAVTTDQDNYTQQYCSNRANGVRFMAYAGGPFKIIGNGTTSTVSATDTTVQFDFGGAGYRPAIGDKLQIPLISQEFDITGVTTGSGTTPTVTLSGQVGYTLTTAVGAVWNAQKPPLITGTFYRRVAYVVFNNQLRYDSHAPNPPYPAAATTPFVDVVTPTPIKGMALVKFNVTSPKPFGLLFPTSTSTVTDASNLRVSLESYDTQYSARLFTDGTTTLQAVIPSRNHPSILSGN